MNHVNVIFEGPDGTGKSTLAKEFATALPAMRICHNAMEGYSAAAMAAMAMHSLTLPYDGLASVVQDRSWLSERVYGDVFREGEDRFYEYAPLLRRKLMATNHVVVQLNSPIDVLWETVSKRPAEEMAKKREQLEAVALGYEEMSADNQGLNFLMLDARAGGTPSNVDLVMDYINAKLEDPGSDALRRWREFGMVGNLDKLTRAKKLPVHQRAILLVADENTRNIKRGIATWLAHELKKVCDEQYLVWLNPFDANGKPRQYLGELLDELASGICSGVLALGREAAKAMSKAGYDTRGVEDPEFLLRHCGGMPFSETDLGAALLHLRSDARSQTSQGSILELAQQVNRGKH